MLPSRAAALLDALPGRGAALLARAPGRVNLIGEHTDYNGLPVLPIAIDRDVLVAARRREDALVELANADPAFAPRRYLVGPAIPPSPSGNWANYHKAAAQALAAELARRGRARLPGGAFRIDGRVPVAAGLSSSSALLVACGLAHLALAGAELRRAPPGAPLAALPARGPPHPAPARRLPGEATGGALPARPGPAAAEPGRFFPAGTALADPARFQLRARVRHVLGEAARVAAAER